MNKQALRNKVLALVNPARNGSKEAQAEIIRLHQEKYGVRKDHNAAIHTDRKRYINMMIQHLLA